MTVKCSVIDAPAPRLERANTSGWFGDGAEPSVPQVKVVAPCACVVFPLQTQLASDAPSGTWLSTTRLLAAADPLFVMTIVYVMVLFFLTVWLAAVIETERLGAGGGEGDSDGVGAWLGEETGGFVAEGVEEGVVAGLPGGVTTGALGEWLVIGWNPETSRA